MEVKGRRSTGSGSALQLCSPPPPHQVGCHVVDGATPWLIGRCQLGPRRSPGAAAAATGPGSRRPEPRKTHLSYDRETAVLSIANPTDKTEAAFVSATARTEAELAFVGKGGGRCLSVGRTSTEPPVGGGVCQPPLPQKAAVTFVVTIGPRERLDVARIAKPPAVSLFSFPLKPHPEHVHPNHTLPPLQFDRWPLAGDGAAGAPRAPPVPQPGYRSRALRPHPQGRSSARRASAAA